MVERMDISDATAGEDEKVDGRDIEVEIQDDGDRVRGGEGAGDREGNRDSCMRGHHVIGASDSKWGGIRLVADE